MYLKQLLLLFSIIFISNSLYSQQLEFMQPVGYQNPFLKSGQFIASLYSYSYQSETEYSDYDRYFRNNNINLVSYLGLTDYLTLATRIAIYPDQKINWSEGNSTQKRKNNFNINPELTLSYRPANSLEIFSSFNYRQYTTTEGPYSYLQSVPVGFDSTTGSIIYEERMFQVTAMNPMKTSSYFFKFGLTYFGRLW